MAEQPMEFGEDAQAPIMPAFNHRESLKSDLVQQFTEDDYNKAKNQYLADMNNMHDQMKDVTLDTQIPTEMESDRQQQFSVTNPMKVQKHIKYTVKGVDGDGPFEEVRRFSEFYALRNMLMLRWPGIYVPAIPEKKAWGNKDDKFVEERRALLEKFLKECAKYDYILNSREFKIFARDKGEIDRVLNMMPKQTPLQILEKYRQNFTIHEEIPSATVLEYKEKIKNFQEFTKKAI